MTNLAMISTVLGGVIVAARAPGLFATEKYRAMAVKFPRNVLAGRIIMAGVALVVWWIMYHAAAASDEWKWTQPLIVPGVPIAYFLVAKYGTSYLAMRATAAALLLVAKQVVDITDLSDHPMRLVLTTLAYVWVVAAIWMTIAPHHFRDLIGWVCANNSRCRKACGSGVALGAFLLLLGLCVF